MSKAALSLLMFTLASPVAAIVVRHDVDPARYLASPADFPPLATFYRIGAHGTLVHPQWVLTAAHAVFCLDKGQPIRVGAETVEVEARYTHPDYRWDGPHDLALVKLARPVQGVQPAALYTGQDEAGQLVWFIGVGATGNGLKGQVDTASDGRLRRAQNRVHAVQGGDLSFRFDRGEQAEPLEGVSGNGDSGGPAYVVRPGGGFHVLGVSSRTDSWFRQVGEYGVKERYTRVSAYQHWIRQVMQGSAAEAAALSSPQTFSPPELKGRDLQAVCRSLRIPLPG